MASVMHVGSGDRIHRMADIVKAFPPIFKKERQKVQGLNYEWSGELFTANDFLGNSVIHDKHNLRALINPLVEGDMSTKGVACACAMIRAGLTFEHVAGVLLNCSNTVSSHYLRQGDPERAAQRAYEWAMENVAKSAEKEQAERQQQEPNGDDPPEPPALWIIDPTRWEGVSIPPREWIVQDMVPAKTVSLLMGDGAAGKTTLALQLATARALGKDWIGTIPNAGRTLFLSAEDDADELHRRLDAVRAHYSASFSDLADLRLVDLVGQDAVLGELQRNGTIKATPLFDAVSKQIGSYGPDFVIIDALADAFAGDENNRTQARQFIGLLKKLARQHGTAFLCLAHPSLYGMNSGSGTSGSTGWSNSVRSRLYFETVKADDGDEPDPDLRQLSLKKTNYGPVGRPLTVRSSAGVYVPRGGGSSLDRLAAAQKAQETFMTLLGLFNEQGQALSPSKGANYAPTVFARHKGGKGISTHQFADAMQELLDRKIIKIEISGSPSRQRKRLVPMCDPLPTTYQPPLPTGYQPLPTTLSTHPPYTPVGW